MKSVEIRSWRHDVTLQETPGGRASLQTNGKLSDLLQVLLLKGTSRTRSYKCKLTGTG